MSKINPFLSAIAISCALLLSACAQPAVVNTAEAERPAFVTSDLITERATVLAVNRPERMVVLRGEDGSTLGLILDERVRNFDQIEVGDTVTAQYQEATAVFVRPATGAPAAEPTGTFERAPLGARPGAAATSTNEITATVESIDYANRIVVVRGPSGRARTFKVSPEVTRLDAVQKGDEVVVRHTEAVAIAVTE
jgi:hypothetical protein